MTSPKKRRQVGQHHGDLRAALLAAALEMLDEASPETLTLREVARRAGVSPAAPYNHFADKNALLAAVAEDGFRSLGEALARAGGASRGRKRLAAVAGEYVRFAIAHPAHYRVMFAPGLVDAEGAQLGEIARAAFENLLRDIGGVAGSLSPEALRREGLLAWSLAHGAASLMIDGLIGGLDPSIEPAELGSWVGAAAVEHALLASGARAPKGG